MALLTPVHVFDKKTRHDRMMPSLPRRIVNVVQSVPAIVSSGFAKVSDEELERRKDICMNKCPLKLWDPTAYDGAGTCLHKRCGCNMKLKSRFTMSRCPENFWETIK